MIQIFFNKTMECYEAYFNGQKIENVISIRVDSENMNLPKATISAFIEVVNEQPQEFKKPVFPDDRIGQFTR